MCSVQYDCFFLAVLNFVFSFMLPRYCLSDFEMVLVTFIITCVSFAFNSTYPEFLL